ncbi:hypothetical protein [Streptosporangium sp. NPDC087985]
MPSGARPTRSAAFDARDHVPAPSATRPAGLERLVTCLVRSL